MLLILLAAVALQAPAQVYRAGPQVLTFFSDIDDSDQPYSLYVPKDFDSTKKYPLVVSLHGEFSNHRLNLRRVFGRGNLAGETDADASRYFPRLRDVDFLVASPLARGTMGYRGIAEKDVYDMMADVKKRFPVDDDRTYLTGLSMGGGGALWLALTRPDRWAAVAAVCPAVPENAEELAENAVNLSIHLFHGALDPAVPVIASREWKRRLEDAGVTVAYTEYPKTRHNAWDEAYRDGAIFEWFQKYRRNPYPDKVYLRTRAYKYASAYWAVIDSFTPGELATLEAEFTAPNRIRVKASGIEAFHLDLDAHPMYRPAAALELTIDGAVIKPRPKMLSFLRSGETWKAGPWKAPAHSKRAGQEGPLLDAFSSRHLYVFGTSDEPGEEEVKHRREQAAKAADWSTSRARLNLQLRVIADSELTNAEFERSNLILFGTRETNSVIARIANELPLHLNSGAADFGLFYVWPLGDRYVVVNSGLPFYVGVEMAQRSGLSFRSSMANLLETFGDYVLFKGSLENIVAEGRFGPQWQLDEVTKRKFAATGAIHGR